jgi:hypothetical protein
MSYFQCPAADPVIFAVSSALFLHVLSQIPRAGFARVEVARGIYHATFSRAGWLHLGAEGRDEGDDLAVPALPMRMPGLML